MRSEKVVGQHFPEFVRGIGASLEIGVANSRSFCGQLCKEVRGVLVVWGG